MKKKYRAAIIGAGNIGAFYSPPQNYKGIITHAHAYQKEKRTQLVAFLDINKKKAQKAAKVWGVKSYTDPQKMFKTEKIDLVSICTPDKTHQQSLKICLKYRPKAVFCEKPFTTDLKAGEELVKTYNQLKIPLAVNYNRRWNQAISELRDRIRKNEFGVNLNNVVIYNKGILHNGSHWIDLLRYFFGEISEAIPLSAKIDWRKTDPTLDAFLKFKKGVKVHLVATNWHHYEVGELDLLFEKARIRLVKAGAFLEYFKIIESPLLREEKVLGAAQIKKTQLTSTLLRAPAIIIDSLENKKRLPCSGADALTTQKICQKLIQLWKN